MFYERADYKCVVETRLDFYTGKLCEIGMLLEWIHKKPKKHFNN